MVPNNDGELKRKSTSMSQPWRTHSPIHQREWQTLLISFGDLGICLPCFHSLAYSRRITECWLISVWSRTPIVQGRSPSRNSLESLMFQGCLLFANMWCLVGIYCPRGQLKIGKQHLYFVMCSTVQPLREVWISETISNGGRSYKRIFHLPSPR